MKYKKIGIGTKVPASRFGMLLFSGLFFHIRKLPTARVTAEAVRRVADTSISMNN